MIVAGFGHHSITLGCMMLRVLSDGSATTSEVVDRLRSLLGPAVRINDKSARTIMTHMSNDRLVIGVGSGSRAKTWSLTPGGRRLLDFNAFLGGKLWGPSEPVDLDAQVQAIYSAFRLATRGRPPARPIFVSPESRVGDMMDYEDGEPMPFGLGKLAEVAEALGISLSPGDSFLEAAARLKAKT